MKKKIAFYDCEIAYCIPDRNNHKDPQYKYCQGWRDFKGMGIACIGAYGTWCGYEVFLANQLDQFREWIAQADEVVGFNSIAFDDQLLAANGIKIETTYDLLCETRVASGQPPHYVKGQTRGGYSLEQLARANLGRGKSGSGELAPKLWQDGRYRDVVAYCLDDVDLTRQLWERRSRLTDPTNGRILCLRGGNRWEWVRTMLTTHLSQNNFSLI